MAELTTPSREPSGGRVWLSRLTLGLLGVGLGIVSAVWTVHVAARHGEIRIGPWHTFHDTGGPDRTAVQRASVAVCALLALRRTEAVYYEADTDMDGRDLDGRCTYELAGNDLPARWWSITVYGRDRFLIPNPLHRWSFTGSNLLHAPDGTWRVVVSPTPHGSNWLPTSGQHGIILVARMFNPAGTVAADPASAPLPSIVRHGCP